MKKILFLVMILVLLVGCQQAADEVAEKKIEKETGADVEIDTKGDNTKMTVEKDGYTMDIDAKNTDSWCPAGTTMDVGFGSGKATWDVEGIEKSGKYEGLCHYTYFPEGFAPGTVLDYYLAEDGSGYQVVMMDGKKIETEFGN